MRKLTLITLTALCSTSALAANPGTVFSCTTDNGKTITLTKSGENYLFSYDKIKFTNPIKQVIANKDSYIATGSAFATYSLELKNAETTYTIQYSVPRNNTKSVEDAMLAIERNGDSTFIYCDDSKKITQHADRKLLRKM